MIKRLVSMIRWDVILQARYGIYYAAGFATLVDIVVATQLIPNLESRQQIVPAMLMLSLVTTTYFFMVALMLFEKDENVLEGLVVTPMREVDYLLSKSTSLTLVTLLAALIVSGVVWWTLRDLAGFALQWHWLILGGLLLGMIGTFLGVWFGSRFDSFNTAMLPSSLIIVVLNLPLVHYFGLLRSPLSYLLPSMGPMTLFGAAFLGLGDTIPAWELAAALVSSVVWAVLGFVLASRAFESFVVRSKGVRA